MSWLLLVVCLGKPVPVWKRLMFPHEQRGRQMGRITFRAEKKKALRNAQGFRKGEATRETCLHNPT